MLLWLKAQKKINKKKDILGGFIRAMVPVKIFNLNKVIMIFMCVIEL
jgi:hypothetical protein